MPTMNLPDRGQAALASTLVALPILWHFSGKALSCFFTKRYTVAYDIPHVSIEREESKRIKGCAVICGGSVAGLLAARICANHFEEVLVIEPEVWTSTPEASESVYNKDGNIVDPARLYKRKRITQYQSIHAFLPIIRDLCNRLFPNFEKALVNGDGRIRKGAIFMQHRDGRIFRDQNDFPIIFASRELFERILRREVLSCKRIRQINGTATGVKTSSRDLCRLVGVTARLADGAETSFPASLVVDCTGPTQAGHKWLKRLFENTDAKPQIAKSIPFDDLRIEYNANIVSRKWRVPIPSDTRPRLPIPSGYDNCGWVYSYLGVIGKDNKAIAINRIEGHRFEIAVSARAEPDYQSPANPEDIIPFMRTISSLYQVPDWVFRMVAILLENKGDWEDLGVDSHLAFSCVQYEKAPFLPHNFVAAGDSFSRVNPIFGQGISKAGASALILDNLLRSKDAGTTIPVGFGRKYADVHNRKLGSIWTSNKHTDYQWSTTTPMKGEDRSIAVKDGKFIDLILQLCVRDDFIDYKMAGLRSFLRPPTDMLHPKVLLKVVWFKLQRKLGFA